MRGPELNADARKETATYRPKASLRMGISLSSSLVLASVLGWVMTPVYIREQFTPVQVLTLLFFLAIMVMMALGIGLSYVRANSVGITFRNGIKTYQVSWSQIKAFRYREGDPWPLVLLRSEVGQRPMLGIQRSDRDYAERCVAELRERLADAYRAAGPGAPGGEEADDQDNPDGQDNPREGEPFTS